MKRRTKKLRFLDFGSALIWATAWVVLAHVLATPAAGVSAFITAVAAFFGGRYLSSRNLRTPSAVIASCLLAPLLLEIANWPAQTPMLAGLFPSGEALLLFTDIVTWGLMATFVVGTLQFLSNRYLGFVSVEVVTVALFLSSPFAAHRDGFINRPYFLIDPLWSRGYDPVPILQAIGVVIAAALVLLTIGRATERSSIFDLALLLALALGLYLYVPQDTLRDLVNDPPTNSGLTGEPTDAKEAEERAAQGGGNAPPGNEPMSGTSGQGKGDSSDNPFPFESSEPDQPKPVAVIVFRDDYDSPDGYFYFRQTAFSQYNGFRLVKDTTNEADKDLFYHFPTREESVSPPPVRYDIPTRSLETRVALIQSHTEPFGLTAPLKMKPAANPNPDQFERAYDVVSHVYGGDFTEILSSNLRNPVWSEEVFQHYLQYPSQDVRYKELADQIIAGIPEEFREYHFARALAITLYLGEKGIYTLRRRPVGTSKDPTADFLFGDMTGYCVHFSHAAVYLMRAAGIPARVGAGYAVEGRNRRGSALLIRSNEAHAWPEVWVDGLGWYALDVAPQTVLDSASPPPDFDLQAMLAEMAREEGETFEQPPEFDLREFLRKMMAIFFNFLPWVLGALLFCAYGMKLERRLSHRFESGDDKIHALYRAAMDRAGEAGYQREYGQGRLSFCEQHGKEIPSLEPLARAHLALKFGKKGQTESTQTFDPEEMYQHYNAVGIELARTTPLWRRILGLLNPISWLSTK